MQDPALRLLNSARSRATQEGTECSITLGDVHGVYPVDGVCPVLGVPLTQGKGKSHDGSPTLDRVNPAWGYVPGNIAVISYAANRAKGSLRAEELERIAAWMRGKGLA